MRFRSWLMAFALATPLEVSAGEGAEESAEPPTRAVKASLLVSIPSEYVAQGMVFEKKGVIVQPLGRVTVSVAEGIDVFAGFFASFHDAHTDAGLLDPPGTRQQLRSFYEADWFAGATLTRDRFSLTSFYAQYYAPNDAYESATSVDVFLNFADKGLLAENFALDPYANLFIETDNKSGTGVSEGYYLQLGLKPNYPHEIAGHEILLMAPLATGFGFDEFYAGDETFGFVSAGFAPVVSLTPWLGDRFGVWSFIPSFNYFHLNEDVQYLRADGDRYVAAATIGVDF